MSFLKRRSGQSFGAQAGVSLPEIMVYLLIAGVFLMLTIPIGQKAIYQARRYALCKKIQEYAQAVALFQGRHACLPGELTNASALLEGKCGDGDEITKEGCTRGSLHVWEHLAADHLITRPPENEQGELFPVVISGAIVTLVKKDNELILRVGRREENDNRGALFTYAECMDIIAQSGLDGKAVSGSKYKEGECKGALTKKCIVEFILHL